MPGFSDEVDFARRDDDRAGQRHCFSLPYSKTWTSEHADWLAAPLRVAARPLTASTALAALEAGGFAEAC